MYNILAMNVCHNGSVAVVSDGEIALYIEEERLSRKKYDANPLLGIMEAFRRFRIDEYVVGGALSGLSTLPYSEEDAYSCLVRKLERNIEFLSSGWRTKAAAVNTLGQHHAFHAAAAFYNSGFKTAAAIVVDGAGAFHSYSNAADPTGPNLEGYETESIYSCAYPHVITPVYKSYAKNGAILYADEVYKFDNAAAITKAYEGVSHYHGFGLLECGKTMGLAPYGEPDPNIPEMFLQGFGSRDLFLLDYPNGAQVDIRRFPYLRPPDASNAWHRDPSLVTSAAKNLAWKVQDETQRLVGDLIEKAARTTGETDIVISGGYALNCVANYYYLDRFPNLNIFVDPIAHDGGSVIGMALLQWYRHEAELDPARDWSNYTRERLRTICLGPDDPEANSAHEPIDGENVIDANDEDVAKLLADGNIVAYFHGRSEGGPRALGNRSILFDPRVPNGKDIVNRAKGREWFRPFAGSVLQEHANAWFDLRSQDESPFMMYAVNVRPDKRAAIPAITHVDGTCRVQTVRRDQNPNYYSLIQAFYKRTGCPVVFNTSFNLAGEPLVETLEDALSSLRRSVIEYLYLPDIGKMIVRRPTP